MAQRRLRDYRDPIGSFEHNIMKFGMHSPGRYCGFDLFQPTGGLGFTIAHSNFQTWKDQNNDTIGPVGIALTAQGVSVVEDAAITGFAVDTNAGNLKDRIDLVICEHHYNLLQGGQAATYSIIKGPIGNTVDPALTDPYHQIILGRVIIPKLAVDLSGARYEKAKAPDSGDGEDARIFEVNAFQRLNQFRQNPNVYTGAAGNAKWNFSNEGNVLVINDPDPEVIWVDLIKFNNVKNQNGTQIEIYIEANVYLRGVLGVDPDEFDEGYRRLFIPDDFVTGLMDNDTVKYYQIDRLYPVIAKLTLINDVWILTSITRLIKPPVEEVPEYKILYMASKFIGDVNPADMKVTVLFSDVVLFPNGSPVPSGVGTNYHVIGTLRSSATDWNVDNDAFAMVRNKSVNGFEILLRELGGAVPQALSYDFIIVALV